jgi:phage protein D
MRPIFKVLADGADIPGRINQRLISIKTTDEAGFKSDTCTIDLDDRDGLIALPRTSAPGFFAKAKMGSIRF